MTKGTLYILATPIGNLEDITLRNIRIFKTVKNLACEDTRTTISLLKKLEIPLPKNIFAYHEHNEIRSSEGILKLLEAGEDVALCTDAGTPGVSDPGFRAISLAATKGIKIEVCPGASSVTTALIASGLSSSSYTFKGFPPRKSGGRKSFFAAEKDLPHTLIFFESKFRIIKTLEDAYSVLGNRSAAVCLELTKQFETVHRGYLKELKETIKTADLRGEITVVIAGNNPKFLGDTSAEED
ncbi:MAG: 16S rRNA (cytidine(1402)-2'-O)-methyltransferase [Ignavibacteriaceae bacterium]|nr:16S rRNA (cytidine(1402)-2'-O)-methyltransferase [Ignavibacteriaceae bacterium]